MKYKSRFYSSWSLLSSTVLTIALSPVWLASAANVSWDITPGTVGPGDSAITGGAGTWDTMLGNWTSDAGATNIVWNNAANDIAVFSGTVGNVQLGGPILAGGMSFANPSGVYAINGAETLTLAGDAATFSVASGGTAYIGNVNASPNAAAATPTVLAGFTGTTGLTKTGGGSLVLIGSASHTYAGDTTVNSGQLAVNAVSVSTNLISSSSTLVMNGGALSFLSAAAGSSQTFNGCTLSSGNSALHVNKGTAGGVGLLSLGAITRNPGATVNLFTSHNGTTTRRIQSSSWTTDQIIADSGVAYATFANSGSSSGAAVFTGNDWASYNGSTIVAATYTDATETELSGNANLTTGIDTALSADSTITSLRNNLAEARSVTIQPGFTLTTGGVLIGSTVAANSTTITGGTLRSAASVSSRDLVVITNNSGITSIGSVVADSAAGATGLTKSGPGNLTLSGSNSYTGPTIINGGSLSSSRAAALGSTPSVHVGGGAALTVSYGGPTSYANPEITTLLAKTTFADATSGFGFDTTDATGGTANFTGGYSASTGLAKSGTGSLVLTGPNSHTGTTSVYGGTLWIANTGALGGTTQGTVVSNGAAVALDGGIAITGEALGLLGDGINQTGALRSVSGNNSWSGGIILAGTARVHADAGSLTLGAVGANGNMVLSGNGHIAVTGLITGTVGITVLDPAGDGTTSGTMTLSGENTNTGSINVVSGRLDLTGNRTASSGSITVGINSFQTGTLNLSNGNFSTGSSNIVVGSSPAVAFATAGTGIVNHSAGTLSTAGLILLGNAGTGNLDSSGTGTYHLSGGTLSSSSNNVAALCLGTNNGGVGSFNLSGSGSLEMTGTGTLQIGRSSSTTTSSTGTFTQTGGSATLANMAMGNINNSNTTSVLDLRSGSFSVTTAFTAMAAGASSSAAITIRDSAIVTLPAIPTVRGAGSTATITFDGGTLKPSATSPNYMKDLTSATLQDGGVTIDVPTGNDINIGQDLLTHESSPGGGLTKSGTGALGLSGINTYTGATTVTEGTLALTGGSQASPITVQNGAFLGFDLASATITSSNSVTLHAGAKVRIIGTPILASYTLMTVTSFSTNPQLEGPIPGYSLVVDGTSLKLNSTSGSYSTWAAAFSSPALSNADADADPDSDGLKNAVEYAVGLDPRFFSHSPGATSNGGKTITFTKGVEAKANLDVSYKIETSISVGAGPTPWTEATPPEVTETADTIAITFPPGPASNFVRLKVVLVP